MCGGKRGLCYRSNLRSPVLGSAKARAHGLPFYSVPQYSHDLWQANLSNANYGFFVVAQMAWILFGKLAAASDVISQSKCQVSANSFAGFAVCVAVRCFAVDAQVFIGLEGQAIGACCCAAFFDCFSVVHFISPWVFTVALLLRYVLNILTNWYHRALNHSFMTPIKSWCDLVAAIP